MCLIIMAIIWQQCCPDIAITGPLNFRYGHEFTCRATTLKDEVGALWRQYTAIASQPARKAAPKKKTAKAARPASRRTPAVKEERM